jgi:hypothetical protein
MNRWYPRIIRARRWADACVTPDSSSAICAAGAEAPALGRGLDRDRLMDQAVRAGAEAAGPVIGATAGRCRQAAGQRGKILALGGGSTAGGFGARTLRARSVDSKAPGPPAIRQAAPCWGSSAQRRPPPKQGPAPETAPLRLIRQGTKGCAHSRKQRLVVAVPVAGEALLGIVVTL